MKTFTVCFYWAPGTDNVLPYCAEGNLETKENLPPDVSDIIRDSFRIVDAETDVEAIAKAREAIKADRLRDRAAYEATLILS